MGEMIEEAVEEAESGGRAAPPETLWLLCREKCCSEETEVDVEPVVVAGVTDVATMLTMPATAEEVEEDPAGRGWPEERLVLVAEMVPSSSPPPP